MSIEERKSELIGLINSVDNELLLIRLKELIKTIDSETPDSIIRLLEISNNSTKTSKHKTVREFLK